MSNWRHLDRACEGDGRYSICLDHDTALPMILHDDCRCCPIGSILTGARGRRKLFKVCRKHNAAFPLVPRDESCCCRIETTSHHWGLRALDNPPVPDQNRWGSGPGDELELCIQGKVYVPELRLLVAFARVRMISPMFFIVSAILSRCEVG